jgi:hypothetical protein
VVPGLLVGGHSTPFCSYYTEQYEEWSTGRGQVNGSALEELHGSYNALGMFVLGPCGTCPQLLAEFPLAPQIYACKMGGRVSYPIIQNATSTAMSDRYRAM